jgi:hypothetical protein
MSQMQARTSASVLHQIKIPHPVEFTKLAPGKHPPPSADSTCPSVTYGKKVLALNNAVAALYVVLIATFFTAVRIAVQLLFKSPVVREHAIREAIP